MSKTLLETMSKDSPPDLNIDIGTDLNDNHVHLDLGKSGNCIIDFPKTMPCNHLLIKKILADLLYKNSKHSLKLILIDNSKDGLDICNDVIHLLTPVIKDDERVISALQWSTKEIEIRIKMFKELGVKSIEEFNQASGFTAMEYILVVICNLSKIVSTSPTKIKQMLSQININGRKTGFIIVATTNSTRDHLTDKFFTKITYHGVDEIEKVIYQENGSDKSMEIRLHEISDNSNNEIFDCCKPRD